VLPGVEQPDPVPYTPPVLRAPTAPVQSVDDILGKETVDDLLGPQPLAEKLAKRWQQWLDGPDDMPQHERPLALPEEGMRKVMDAFSEGYRNADPRFGKQTGLDDETVKTLRDLGLYNDYEKGHVEAGKAFLEAATRPAAAALEGFLRTMSGYWRATQEGRVQAGLPKDLAVVEEAFPHPRGVSGITGRPVVPGISVLTAAKELGILGDTPPPPPAAPLKPVQVELPKAPDVEGVARSTARQKAEATKQPDPFERLDTLTEGKTQLSKRLEELEIERDLAAQRAADKSSAAKAIERIEKRLADKSRTPEERVKDQVKLAEAKKARDDLYTSRVNEDTSEMRLARQDLEEIERQLAENDANVKKALADAKGPTAQAVAEYNALLEQPDMFGYRNLPLRALDDPQGLFRFMDEMPEQAVPNLSQEGKAGPGKLRAMPPPAPMPEAGVIRRPDGTVMGKYRRSTEDAVQQELPLEKGAAVQRELDFARDLPPTTPPATPTLPFEARPHPLLDKDGNIRMKMLRSQNDVQDAIKAAKPDGAHKRRTVLSLAETEKLADALGVAPSELNRKKIGRTFSEEQVQVAQELLTRSATEVRDAALKAALGGEEDLLAYAIARERHKIIQSEVSRGLRDDRNIRNLQEGLNDPKYAEATSQRWAAKSLDELRTEAEIVAMIEGPAGISKQIADMSRLSWWQWFKRNWQDLAVEFGMANLLGRVTTQIVNAIGSNLTLLADIPDTFTAGLIGTLHKGEKVYLGETKEKLFGLMSSAKDWPIIYWEVMRHEDMLRSTTKFELPKQVIPGVAGTIIRTPLRSLGATDMAFKHMAYTSEIRAQAYRLAKQESGTGPVSPERVAHYIAYPTEKMVEAATKHADHMVFADELGRFTASVQKAANAIPVAKVAVPFTKTLTNLLKWGVEHSPAAPIMTDTRNAMLGRQGNIARDKAYARAINGTLAGLALYSLAAEGTITGAGPLDPREREGWMLAGNRPYSIRFGDFYYGIKNLDPLSNIMMVMADAVTLSEVMTDEETDEVGKLMLKSLNNTVIDKSWASGLAQLFRAIQDPDRYGDSYMASLSGWVVPGMSATIAEEQDPYLRQAKGFIDGVRARLPGEREKLLTKLNIFGEPMKRDETLGPDWLSPIRYSAVNDDPVVRTLNDLGVWPGRVAKKIAGVDLTDEQHHDYQRIAGQFMKKRLDTVVNAPGFETIPDPIKAKIIKAEVKATRKAAARVTILSHPDINLQFLENKRKAITGE
jgi:hypothetical protein